MGYDVRKSFGEARKRPDQDVTPSIFYACGFRCCYDCCGRGYGRSIALNVVGWNLSQASLNEIAVPALRTWALETAIGAIGMLILRRNSWPRIK